jgi:hypothetical protein
MGDSGRRGGSEDQNTDRNATIKAMLMWFQMEMTTLLGAGLEAVLVTPCQKM